MFKYRTVFYGDRDRDRTVSMVIAVDDISGCDILDSPKLETETATQGETIADPVSESAPNAHVSADVDGHRVIVDRLEDEVSQLKLEKDLLLEERDTKRLEIQSLDGELHRLKEDISRTSQVMTLSKVEDLHAQLARDMAKAFRDSLRAAQDHFKHAADKLRSDIDELDDQKRAFREWWDKNTICSNIRTP